MTHVDGGGRLRRVPNAPRTPTHGFRCPDDLYRDAKFFAEQDGETISDVLRRELERYVKRKRAAQKRQSAAGEEET